MTPDELREKARDCCLDIAFYREGSCDKIMRKITTALSDLQTEVARDCAEIINSNHTYCCGEQECRMCNSSIAIKQKYGVKP